MRLAPARKRMNTGLRNSRNDVDFPPRRAGQRASGRKNVDSHAGGHRHQHQGQDPSLGTAFENPAAEDRGQDETDGPPQAQASRIAGSVRRRRAPPDCRRAGTTTRAPSRTVPRPAAASRSRPRPRTARRTRGRRPQRTIIGRRRSPRRSTTCPMSGLANTFTHMPAASRTPISAAVIPGLAATPARRARGSDDQEQAPVEQRQAGAGPGRNPFPERMVNPATYMRCVRRPVERWRGGGLPRAGAARPRATATPPPARCRRRCLSQKVVSAIPASSPPARSRYIVTAGARASEPPAGGANGSGRMSKTPASHAPRQIELGRSRPRRLRPAARRAWGGRRRGAWAATSNATAWSRTS